MYTVDLPCKPGDDFWWVDTDEQKVVYEKGGITGVVIRAGEIVALDPCGEEVEIHSQWCCLSKEEAEALKAKLFP